MSVSSPIDSSVDLNSSAIDDSPDDAKVHRLSTASSTGGLSGNQDSPITSASPTKGSDKHARRMAKWLQDGSVVYKSVGFGLLDLVVGMQMVKVAVDRGVGTKIVGFSAPAVGDPIH